VKYETVIGIIGNTHGVSSDNAPIVIASQINPQIGWLFMSLSAVRATGAALEFVGTVFEFETMRAEFVPTFAFEFTDKFALEFTFVGVGDPVGLGETLGLGVGETAPAAPIVIAADSGTVFGGRHTVSLQTWYRTFVLNVEAPAGASALTVNGTVKAALPVYDSVLIPKFGSSLTLGLGPDGAPIEKGPSPRLMRVGMGPPPPCVMEYICQPPPMLALIFATPLPPAGTLVGETVIVSETGFCAQRLAANVAIATHNKID